MGGLSFRQDQAGQTDHGRSQYNEKRHGCPAEVLSERGNAQQQAEEDQYQDRSGHIKVLQRHFSGYLVSGSKDAGGKNTGANGNADP